MPNSRFGYSVKKNSFKGLNIDCVQYSNIIRITYYSYSYSYSGTILNPNIIRIRIRPNICARILFVFVFAHSEKTNIIRIRIRSKIWFRILFVFVFGPKNSIRSPLTEKTLDFEMQLSEASKFCSKWWTLSGFGFWWALLDHYSGPMHIHPLMDWENTKSERARFLEYMNVEYGCVREACRSQDLQA